MKVEDILLETAGHLLYLDELMAIVLIKYAFDAYGDCAKLAEIFDRFVVMPRTIDEILGVITSRLRFPQITIGEKRQYLMIL